MTREFRQGLIQRALELHGQGQLTEAISLYEQALASEPNDVAVAANLASALVKAGRVDQGLERYRAIVDVEDSQPEIWFNYANALQRAGRLEDSRQAFERTLDLHSDFFPAVLNLANLVRDSGEFEAARQLYVRAVGLNPEHPRPRINLARMLRSRRLFDEARTVLQQGLQQHSQSVELLYDLALVEHAAGELVRAVEVARSILSLNPASGQAFNILGLLEFERGHSAAAIEWWNRLSRHEPANPEGPMNLGTLFQKHGQNDEAVAAFREAVRRAPDDLGANLKLGLFLSTTGHVTEAMEIGRRLKELFSDRVDGEALIANGFHEQGLCDEAMDAFERALSGNPEETTLICNALFSSLYSDSMSDDEIVKLHREFGERLTEIAKKHLSSVEPVTARSGRKRIRIGYLSPDLLQHPVGYFMEPILTHHDRSDFEIICYSDRASSDELTERLRKLELTWHETSAWSDDRLNQQIRSDGLDILIDLAGHTAKNRSLVLASRPAPVLATYLGYPGKTERPSNDWLIADAVVCPQELQTESHEQIAHLPDCFLCYQPQPDVPDVSSAPFEKNGCVTFGSFNHLAKVTDSTVRLWSDVLKAVPDSRLILKALPLADETVRRSTRQRFVEYGIDPVRIETLAPTVPLSAFLAEYSRIDIALDTVPFNGGTTTCEALWMGVPVVTLPGTRFCSRMGLSVLKAVGFEEFAAGCAEDYVRIASELAADPSRLIELRQVLRSRISRSSLASPQRFIESYESLIRRIAGSQAEE